ncbi:hypothetical protein [Alienimonas sp. DA493]|uniref:hypothetical protein n=1 Tax=Alienimonas sp. DA493 TaxID=3373605 RepID=UPI003754B55E
MYTLAWLVAVYASVIFVAPLVAGAATAAYWRKYRDRDERPDDYADTVLAGYVLTAFLVTCVVLGTLAFIFNP